MRWVTREKARPRSRRADALMTGYRHMCETLSAR
jgi:hypothetical protein